MKRRRPQHHPYRRRLRGFGYYKQLGPGLITGAADDDPSGIGTYSQIGASLGNSYLWTAPLSLPLTIGIIEACARLGLARGKGLAALARESFPRYVLYLLVACVVLANTFNIGADFSSMAAATRLIIPFPYVAGIALFAAGSAFLEVKISYHRYSKVLRYLVLSLVAYVGVLFFAHIHWGVVLKDTFVPTLPRHRTQLIALTAIFGTTISPYMFFWQTSEEVEATEDGYDAETESAPELTRSNLRAMRVDVFAGITAGVFVMFAIMASTSATLHAHGITNITSAEQAALALRPIAGHFSSLLFAIGIVGTGLLAVPVLAGSTAYALTEAFGWREGLSRKITEAPAFYGAIVASFVAGAMFHMLGINPIRSLYYAAVLNGVAAPPLLVAIAVLGRRQDGLAKASWLSTGVVLLGAAIMGFVPLASLFVK